MPLPSGKATFEEALVLLQSTADPMEMVRRLPAVVEGFEDLKNRMSVIERGYLDARTRLAATEAKATETLAVATSTSGDTKNALARVDTLEKTPLGHGNRLDALEDRVRTVEGAVGVVPGKKTPPPAEPDLPAT